MGETTHISWCDHTFNPWVGCMRVSNGPKGACEHCYAAALVDTRFGWAKFGGPGEGVGTRKRTSIANWQQPLKWNRAAIKAGTRPFVFCASLADVFDNAVEPQWRRDLFDLIRATPQLTWLLLTKRPQNIVGQFTDCYWPDHVDPTSEELQDDWPRNAAIGCTVVTQEEADRDVPHLLQAKDALRPTFAFLSMEPLMGAVHLSRTWDQGKRCQNYLTGEVGVMHADGPDFDEGSRIDWVITGGETDQAKAKSRLSHPEWFRHLRDQCAAAGVAYHHKQNGEWRWAPDRAHFKAFMREPWQRLESGMEGVRPAFMVKEGKVKAGRMLDGEIHDARPQVAA